MSRSCPCNVAQWNVTVANNAKARLAEGTLHIRMTLSSNPLPVDRKILIRLPGEYCNDVILILVALYPLPTLKVWMVSSLLLRRIVEIPLL